MFEAGEPMDESSMAAAATRIRAHLAASADHVTFSDAD
jgi:hypothetical protein